MHWKVRLSGERFDLERLSEVFTNDGLRIVQEQEKFYLLSTDFAPEADAREIDAQANELLLVLNGAARLALRGRTPISNADPERIRDDGGREVFCMVRDGILIGDFVRHDDDPSPANPVPAWLDLGLSDPSVARALRLYGRWPQDWANLYRIFEIIETDVGPKTILQQGWATKSAMTNFARTACHPDPTAAGDDARHGATKAQPPPSPMTLSEARALIELLLHRWLDHKAHSTPHN